MRRSYSRSELVAYIVSELAQGTDQTILARNVAAYLMDMNKLQELNSVMRDAQEARAQQSGIVEVTVRSAHTLDAPQMQQIEDIAKQQYSTATSVLAHTVHDESVVGGASVQLPHGSLDVTIRSKLNQLREAVS